MEHRRPWQDEWKDMRAAERRYIRKYRRNITAAPNAYISEKMPDGLDETLEKAFVKAFNIVFKNGAGLIDRMVARDGIDMKYRGSVNLIFSGIEGVGLGIFGIGLPDIPIFTVMLLKSVYEISAHHGYPYDTEKEKFFVLRLIWAALSYGDVLRERDAEIDDIIRNGICGEESEYIETTASALSKELLYMKFVQGIPLVGAVGGAYDAVCMNRVQRYASSKYRRRYLYEHAEELLL